LLQHYGWNPPKFSCACLRRRLPSPFLVLSSWTVILLGTWNASMLWILLDHRLTAHSGLPWARRLLSRKNELQIALHTLPIFSSMVATVQLTLRRVFCLHYGTNLPLGSMNNVLIYNRVTDFCEHHFHGNKLGNLTFRPPSWHQMGQPVKIRCKLHWKEWIDSLLGGIWTGTS
jgi:hypothetical protein